MEILQQFSNGNATAIVLGATADIGRNIARRLLSDKWNVVGLGRKKDRIEELLERQNFRFVSCELSDTTSMNAAVEEISGSLNSWNLFVSSAGTMEPIGRFFDLDFDEWENSFVVNSSAQLRILHGLWPIRAVGENVDIMLLAGGGTNNALTNYSAYCLSKIALIKACELIDDEEVGTNAFIIGPGFVQTRIHEETIKAKERSGAGFAKTEAFLKTAGTSFDDIYAHMRWCMDTGKSIAGGRNFSTVHDPWRDGGDALKMAIGGDNDAFRLRRHNPVS